MKYKLNVMVVDDEPHIVNLVRLSLDSGEYNVIGAYSAREALSSLSEFEPDLMLVDIMMPGMNGFDLCKEIRSKESTKDIPIIILSAKSQIHDKLEAIEAGVDDYLAKPFDPMELEKRIQLNVALKV